MQEEKSIDKQNSGSDVSLEIDHLSKIPPFYMWVSMTAVDKLEPWKQNLLLFLEPQQITILTLPMCAY